jgi:hypothetical protein
MIDAVPKILEEICKTCRYRIVYARGEGLSVLCHTASGCGGSRESWADGSLDIVIQMLKVLLRCKFPSAGRCGLPAVPCISHQLSDVHMFILTLHSNQ